MNENTINLILELVKIGSGIATQIIPIFIHRDASGNVIQLTPIIILEKTDPRNDETLKLIAMANSQPVK
jgi:hypothetical protein